MNPSSPPDSQDPKPSDDPELEARLRRMREERVRKSLAALDRDRFAFTSATGAANLVKVVGIVIALLALWWFWAQLT